MREENKKNLPSRERVTTLSKNKKYILPNTKCGRERQVPKKFPHTKCRKGEGSGIFVQAVLSASWREHHRPDSYPPRVVLNPVAPVVLAAISSLSGLLSVVPSWLSPWFSRA